MLSERLGHLIYLMGKEDVLVYLVHLVPLLLSQGSGCHVQLLLPRFQRNLSIWSEFEHTTLILSLSFGHS